MNSLYTRNCFIRKQQILRIAGTVLRSFCGAEPTIPIVNCCLKTLKYTEIGRSYLTSSCQMGKTALVVVANGSEEIEAVTPIDVLRRAGVEVTVAGLLDSNPQTCSRNVVVGVEKSFKEAIHGCPYDAILLPGGAKGAEAFVASEELGELLREQDKAGRIVASICAGPTALKQHGIGKGKSLTSYPSFKEKIVDGNQYNYKEDRVVVDGNLITSRGPGTALEWSLAIVANLVGKESSEQIAKAMLLK